MFDVFVTRLFINLMYSVAVVSFFFNSFAFSNQQMFRNKIVELDPKYVYPSSDHFYDQFFYEITPGTPLFIGFWFVIFLNILSAFVNRFRMAFHKYHP